MCHINSPLFSLYISLRYIHRVYVSIMIHLFVHSSLAFSFGRLVHGVGITSVRAVGRGGRGHAVSACVRSSERTGLRDHVRRTGLSQVDLNYLK